MHQESTIHNQDLVTDIESHSLQAGKAVYRSDERGMPSKLN